MAHEVPASQDVFEESKEDFDLSATLVDQGDDVGRKVHPVSDHQERLA
jgi:hypothetical protein